MRMNSDEMEGMTMKEGIKIYLDYVVAVTENNARWEKLTRREGEEE